MGLSIGPDSFESFAIGDAPLVALMLGDVELWSTETAPAVLVPMSWGSTTTNLSPGSGDLVTYTVVGSGYVDLSGVANMSAVNTNYTGQVQHIAYIYKNGTSIAVASAWGNSYASTPVTVSKTIAVNDGDVISFKAQVGSGFNRTLHSWSFTLKPMVVRITSTAAPQARDQFRAALTSIGLSYSTVETLPFQLDTSGATSLDNMFFGCAKLKTVPPMVTSQATKTQSMFYDCVELVSVPDLQTANVTDARNMFWRCGKLTDGNVRLIGKHPTVNTSNMTYQSGLTRAPFFDVNGNPV